jgi:hypothetical protein
MHSHDEITETSQLEAKGITTEFPAASRAFHEYKADLLRYLTARFPGCLSAGALQYNDVYQRFYIWLQTTAHPNHLSDVKGEVIECIVKKCVWIDPKKPLEPQVEEIKAAKQRLRRAAERIEYLAAKAGPPLAPKCPDLDMSDFVS